VCTYLCGSRSRARSWNRQHRSPRCSPHCPRPDEPIRTLDLAREVRQPFSWRGDQGKSAARSSSVAPSVDPTNRSRAERRCAAGNASTPPRPRRRREDVDVRDCCAVYSLRCVDPDGVHLKLNISKESWGFHPVLPHAEWTVVDLNPDPGVTGPLRQVQVTGCWSRTCRSERPASARLAAFGRDVLGVCDVACQSSRRMVTEL
jgi:hypothetical protein